MSERPLVLVIGDRTIPLDRTCPTCDGTGLVAAADWVEWRQRWDEWRKRPDCMQTDAPETPEGPEEEVCVECDGTGWVLTPWGKEIVALVRRHVVGL